LLTILQIRSIGLVNEHEVRSPIEPAAPTLNGILASHARFGGDRTAFLAGAEVRTWREIDAEIEAVAQALERRGIGKGSTVAMLAPNSFAAISTMFGTARAGAAIVPLSPLLQPEVLTRLVADAGARLFFIGAPYQSLGEKVEGLADGARISIGFADADKTTPFEAFVAGPVEPKARDYDPQNPYCIIYSSGTTGIPKGIVHTDFTRLQMALLLGIEFNMDSTAVTILATPPFTNGTWMTMIPTMATGGSCVLMPSFTPDGFLEAVERHRGTHVFLVPTQIRAILESPEIDRRDISSLRRVISAGAALPPALRERFVARAGPCLMELYGVTEGVGTTIKPLETLRKPGSVGLPAFGTELKIVGDDGREVPNGEVGEIVGRTSAVMRGYHNRPEADRDATWWGPDGLPYLRTGDMGRLDADGYLYIVDRKKDMMLSGGLNVYPSDIEGIVQGHPAVRDASVVGAPDEKWGEVPVAFVVARKDAALDPQALLAWCNERLSKHQRLQRVVVVEGDLPRNALGKVLKNELRARLETSAAPIGGPR